VQAKVNPTEDSQKVRKAIENVFSDLKFGEKSLPQGTLLTAYSGDLESLSRFGDILRRERIRAAARSVLFQGLKGNVMKFCLNKQVAYAGHISFCEPFGESPLGPIKVQIKCDDPPKLIDWLAPRTRKKKA
jgi:predicted RNA binding protein with dsRBD fold (UPF0201 family)